MKRIALVIAVLALLLPGAALASGGSSTCQSYSPQTCQVVNGASATTASTLSSSAGTLPFTGLDVVLLAAGGAALLGAGLAIRRLSSGLNS